MGKFPLADGTVLYFDYGGCEKILCIHQNSQTSAKKKEKIY